MIKKGLTICLVIAASLFVFSAAPKHAVAVVRGCFPPDGDYSLCPPPSPPSPEPGGTVSNTAPVAGSGVYIPPSTKYPFGNPMGSSYQGTSPKTMQPYFDVGNDSEFNYTKADYNIYGVPGEIVHIDIVNAGAGCQTVPRGDGAGGPDYNDDGSSNGPTTSFGLWNAGAPLDPNWQDTGHLDRSFPKERYMTAGDGCDTVKFSIQFAKNGSNSLPAPGNIQTGDGKDIRYITLRATAPAGSPRGENSFTLKGDTASDLVGFSTKITGVGFRDSVPHNQSDWWHQNWTAQFVFGVTANCTNIYDDIKVSPKLGNAIGYSDTDVNGPYHDPNMKIALQWRPADTPGTWYNMVDDFTPDQSGTIPSSGTLTFSPTKLYRLLLKNFGTENTVHIAFNEDRLNALATAFDPTPEGCADFSCSATVVDEDTVNVRITNNAPWPWGKGYQLRERDSSDNPVSVGGVKQVWPQDGFGGNFPANGGSNNHDFARPPNADVHFVLYDDTGSNANAVAFNPDVRCGTGATTSVITVTCTVVESDDVEPGQSDASLYRVTLTAKGSGTGGNYSVTMAANPGANVTGTNPQTVAIADNPGSPGVTYPVNFAGYLTYSGNFTATVTDPSGGQVATCSGSGTPASRPYFVVRNGDISTGGGFESASGSCNSSGDPGYITPAASNYTTNKSNDSGGLRAFSSPSSRGSSASFGVDALGEIYKNVNTYIGFYSGSGALFANTNQPATSWGGYLNSNSTAHCVLDFYDNTRTGSQNSFTGGDVSGLVGQYQAAGNVTISGGTINHGQQATIYVNGDVTITGNITNQQNWDATNPADVPFLTIIAKGNITLTAGVSRLDGLFIAQPTGSGNSTTGGAFYTCDDFCPGQLVVNGAVIAQEIHLLHAHGTLCGNGSCSDQNNLTTTPAEIFNYSPAMVIGLPDFSQSQSLNGILEGLFSLPPVF